MEDRLPKVESDIATMQLDIRELRGDMKAANEGIADLRTSVATLDGKVNSLSIKLDANVQALNEKIDVHVDSLHEKIDGHVRSLHEKIDVRFNSLNDKIDASAKFTDARHLALEGKVDSGFDKQIR